MLTQSVQQYLRWCTEPAFGASLRSWWTCCCCCNAQAASV